MQHPLKNIMCLPRWHVCLMKKQHCFNGILLSESSFFYQKHFLPFSRLFFMSILIFVDVIWRECLDGILSELPQMLTWSYGWTEQICKVFTGELIRITLDKHAWKLKHHWFTEACKCNAIFLVLFGLCESLNNLCPWAFLLCNILWFCILRPIFKETCEGRLLYGQNLHTILSSFFTLNFLIGMLLLLQDPTVFAFLMLHLRYHHNVYVQRDWPAWSLKLLLLLLEILLALMFLSQQPQVW